MLQDPVTRSAQVVSMPLNAELTPATRGAGQSPVATRLDSGPCGALALLAWPVQLLVFG